MSKPKQTYNLSNTILNSLDFHLSSQGQWKEKSYESFVKTLNKIFETNEHIERGFVFEDEVIAGKHSVFNEYLVDTNAQEWLNAYVDYGDYQYRIAGKADLIRKDRTEIYDIKRTANYKPGRFKMSNQHILYFYCVPEAQVFKYLIHYDKNLDTGETNGYAIEEYKRPTNLDKMVRHRIDKLMNYLHEHYLLPVYIEKHKYKGKL